MKMNRLLIVMFAMVTTAAVPLLADTWYDSSTGYTWTYRIVGNGAEIYGEEYWDEAGDIHYPAISPDPSGSVAIPATLGGKPVTSVGDYSFAFDYWDWDHGNNFTNVTIPSSVTYIGDMAFYNCSNLADVNIPTGVTSIGSSAFYGCRGLTSVTIHDSVTSIGDSAFYGCSGLTGTLAIPNSVTSIGNSVFRGCSSLASVIIPDSVTSIGYSAFYGCGGLTSVIIPGSVTSIGDSVFSCCSGLTNITVDVGNVNYMSGNGLLLSSDGETLIQGINGVVTIPDSVTTINYSAFYGCSGLTDVTIPDSVTSIGGSAFSGCSGLTGTLTIPDSVTSIGDSAFYGCSGLTGTLALPDSAPLRVSDIKRFSIVPT